MPPIPKKLSTHRVFAHFRKPTTGTQAVQLNPSTAEVRAAFADGKFQPETFGRVLTVLASMAASTPGGSRLARQIHDEHEQWLFNQQGQPLSAAEAANVCRTLQHAASAAFADSDLIELIREIKRHYRTRSAREVIYDYAERCVSRIIQNCPGMADSQKASGSQMTQVRTTGVQAGVGADLIAPKVSAEAVLSWITSSDLNVDDDLDINYIKLKGGSAGGKVKAALLSALNTKLSADGNVTVQDLRGQFIETRLLRDTVAIALMHEADAKHSPMHESTNTGYQRLRTTFNQAKAGVKSRIRPQVEVLAEPDRPDFLSAQKMSRGAVNQARIQFLFQKVLKKTGANAANCETVSQEMAKAFPKPSDAFAAGPLYGLPVSGPAGRGGPRRGHSTKHAFKVSSAGASANFNATGLPVFAASAGLKVEHVHRRLALERLKHAHEFLDWSYSGGAERTAELLCNIQSRMSGTHCDFTPLLTPLLEVSRDQAGAGGKKPESLSRHSMSAYADQTRKVRPGKLVLFFDDIKEATDLLNTRFLEFLSARDVWIADPTSQSAKDALSSLDRLVFGGRYALPLPPTQQESDEFFARIQDAFSVGLAAVAHQLSLLKKSASNVVSAETEVVDCLNESAIDCSTGIAAFGAMLRQTPSTLVPDQLLRFCSVQAVANSIKTDSRITGNVDARVGVTDHVPLAASITLQDVVPLQVASVSLKTSVTLSSVPEHPNPVRTGKFIELSLSIGAGTPLDSLSRHAAQLATQLMSQLRDRANVQMDLAAQSHMHAQIASAIERSASHEGAGSVSGLFSQETLQINLKFRAPLGKATSPGNWRLQRGRILHGHTSKLKLATPGGLPSLTGAPVTGSVSHSSESTVVKVSQEWKGADLAYHVLQYVEFPGWNSERGEFDAAELQAALKDHRRADAMRLLNHMDGVMGLLRSYQGADGYGSDGESSNFQAESDSLHAADCANIYSAARPAAVLRGGVNGINSVPAVPEPQKPGAGAPLALKNGAAWPQAADFNYLADFMKQKPGPERLAVFLARNPIVVTAYCALMDHYCRQTNQIKNLRTYRMDVRPDVGVRPVGLA